MVITSLILILAFVIYNRNIIYTFKVPDLKILAFVTFNFKNGADVVKRYNLLDRLMKSREEANLEGDMKSKQFEIMRKIIKFYEAIIYIENNSRQHFKDYLMGVIQEFPVSALKFDVMKIKP